jgi:transposase InsO family protein
VILCESLADLRRETAVERVRQEARRERKRPGPRAHDDLLERQFTADHPNQLWLTDITEHWTDQGKLYLCAIKDVWSNRIVGSSISDRTRSRLGRGRDHHGRRPPR